MADAEPTIRYTVQAGKPVVEVGGAWTVFSLRGFRAKADKAREAAGSAKAARLVDASGVKRLDTAGALEILELAGGGADSEIKTAE
jgi:phospholipid/cholesterol/gamma-HCH transport system permease protein